MNPQAIWIRDIAQKQDREAFASLFGYFAPRLRSYLRSGGLTDSLVEEVLQEVMLTVWRQAGRYNADRAAVSTWIFTIARNRRIDRQRRSARPEPAADTPGIAPQAMKAPDDAAMTTQRAERLRTALMQLPEEQALILRRMYFDGISQRQIAQELALPVGTVKSRVRLAMQRMRAVLDAEAP